MTTDDLLRAGVKGLVALGIILVSLFVVIFLGGLCSAWFEVRAERKAGKPVTRPAWESRRKRRAIGSRRERVKATWAQMSTKAPMCWCGLGPLQDFPSHTEPGELETGCAAWEVGIAEAIRRHDAAGGYARVPVTPTEQDRRDHASAEAERGYPAPYEADVLP